MKLKKINIHNFRHIENQTIEFGDAITVISGLNGTGKSSILGLAGHFFTTPDSSIKTLSGRDFSTKQAEVFRLCPKYDYGNTYSYTGIIEDENGIVNIPVKTRYMQTEKRLKFDIDGRKNKYKFPVIYIGLKRLFPNASEFKFNTFENDLTLDNEKFIINEMKNIMVFDDNNSSIEKVITQNKNFYGLKTEKYAAAGMSAGQDNLGQILTSILSFNKFKNGGILLIDEIEATIFPAAQLNLIEKLYKYSKKFNLQIIFTTHSIEIMKHLIDKKWSGVTFNFLELQDGNVINTVNPEFDYIEHKIKAIAKIKNNKCNYKELICEDELAALWIKGLLSRSDILKQIRINYKQMNDGCIKILAESKMKCFENFIFVLDGDCKNKPQYKNLKNVVFLPGEFPPEVVMYKYLKSLKDSDPFWKNDMYFDKNACFNLFMDEKIDNNKCKNWYLKNKPFFGRGLSKFFTKWKNDNVDVKNDFISKIRTKL